MLALSAYAMPMIPPQNLTDDVLFEKLSEVAMGLPKFDGWPKELTSRPLIFDMGLYNGRDCLELLRTGARVVSLDANPRMVDGARSTFAPFIKSGQLQLIGGALSKDRDGGGTLPFYVHKINPEWSSLDEMLGCRSTAHKDDASNANAVNSSLCTKIDVPILSCKTLMKTYGVPYQLRLDIEDHEGACLQELKHISEFQTAGHEWSLPMYLSWEGTPQSVDEISVAELVGLGYGRFKMVQQDYYGDWSGPQMEAGIDNRPGHWIGGSMSWHPLTAQTVDFPCYAVINGKVNMNKRSTWCDVHIALGTPSAIAAKPYWADQQWPNGPLKQNAKQLADTIGLKN
jgi:hypothetical protein